jgi:hypothetical protein
MATSWPIQQVGSTGEDVRSVQYLLDVHGHPVGVDGSYGPQTKAAVQAVQTARGLAADGVVGQTTWQALIVTVAGGASGAKAKAVQGQLRDQGWRLGLDGSFGSATAAAVRDFQAAHGLRADGNVGPLTWFALVAGFARLPTPDLAGKHLFDAWGARDRLTALTGATQAAVDLVLRGERGTLTGVGCAPDDVLGAGLYVCTYTYEGGAVTFQVRGSTLDGYYVESAAFVVD